ncbi:plasmid SOS inhibition protein A [Klebsiella pneumoniae]|uniref:plasmid SOS inhibition protein A n=1 Tax=Klebsiella pneumoniae TaxID=573 RepID=UPI000E2CEF93|nr:plasmid SOS inhibition protein A [Klebsiella pneumoniae]SYD75264.1 plasmid SOS inhibition protein A [Klebsiella pneumoniae]
MILTSLVPINAFQRCAMASIASVENRRSLGRKTGELAYVKAFFKELTGKSQITSNDLRKVDASYDPFVRGEATKFEYLRAIDILIESRGERFILPLSRSLAVSMFPGLQNRDLQRREHRDRIHEQRVERLTIKESNLLNYKLELNVSKSRLYLSFCLPGQHKLWLEEWRNDIHGQGLTTTDIYLLINDWWSSFWITSYRKDYIWCYTLADLLDEIDYVLSTITITEYNVCFSALPLSLIYKAR